MLMEKLKNILPKTTNEGNDKKKIENIMVFILILIITIIAINGIFGSKKDIDNNKMYQNKKLVKMEKEKDNMGFEDDEKNRLSRNLESILSKIKGVRKSKCFNCLFSGKSKNTNVQ